MPRRLPRWLATTLIAMLVLAGGATAAWAQASSGLTGRVTDNTGGVLPGVTVSAECACLGAARVAVTGGEGRFNITTLPVGSYSVTMTLPMVKVRSVVTRLKSNVSVPSSAASTTKFPAPKLSRNR